MLLILNTKDVNWTKFKTKLYKVVTKILKTLKLINT